MKIVFINPAIGPYPVNFKLCMDLAGAKSSHIPLSIATIAALTPPDAEQLVLDENIEPLPETIDADIIALSGTIMQKKRLFALAKKYKTGRATVVIGGPITFYQREECAQHADVVFVGEAEETWPRFIADHRAGAHAPLYEAAGFVDFALSPVPRLDLLKTERYAAACVQTTRGCPHKCRYCDVPGKYGDAPRVKAVAQVLREVENADRLGFDSVFFVDDNLIGNRAYAVELLTALADQLKGLKNRMSYYTQLTLNVAADEELLALLKRASFKRLFIGIETYDTHRLRLLNKKHNLEMDMREAIRRIHAHGLTVWAGIMVGLEGRDYAATGAMLDFIQSTGITPLQVGIMQAVPETPLYAHLAKKGGIARLPSVFGTSAIADADTPRITNIVYPGLTDGEVRHAAAGFYEKLYQPDLFASRIIHASKEAAPGAAYELPRITWRNVKVLARTIGHYLFRAAPAQRRMFFRLLAAVAKREIVRVDELVFNLVIYKHLSEYYNGCADRMRN